MTWKRALVVILLVLGVALVGIGAWVKSVLWLPAPVEDVAVTCAPGAPSVPTDRPLRVLVWNIQFGASRRHHFFYDGGEAVHVPEADVRATLEAVAARIEQLDPDVVLLQEVDRASDRTARIDQHADLLRRVPFPCHASTPYHRVRYLPHPSHRHLGRVEMHLSVFSRYRLDGATRVQLALLDEPAWRQALNLRRAVLDVSLPLADGRTLRLLNTHLSAFSMGDGTLERQVATLDRLATDAEISGQPWLLGGDLNALPPGDDAARLGAEAEQYPEDVTPAQLLFDRWASAVPAPLYRAEPERWRTYLPFGATAPDRTLDYVFVGRRVDVRHVEVVPDTTTSDHLPLLVEVEFP